MDDERRQAIALWRFGVLGPLVSARLEHGDRQQYFRSAAERVHEHPDGRLVRLSPRTIEDWYLSWRKGGFHALWPADRVDQGTSRAIRTEVADLVVRAKREKPRRSIRRIIRMLERAGVVRPKELSRSSVHRLLKVQGISERPVRGPAAERRSFIMEHAGDLWIGDALHGPKVIVPPGRRRKAYLLSQLDCATRYVPHSYWTTSEGAAPQEYGLKQAVLKYGLPASYYVDLGSAYIAKSLRLICAELDIQLLHTGPGDAEAKGAIERWHRTAREEVLDELGERTVTLDELNSLYWAWLAEEYHARKHDTTGRTPGEHWLAEVMAGHCRPVPRNKDLDDVFLHRLLRTVRKDGTVRFKGRWLEVSAELSDQVELRFDPSDPDALPRVFVRNEFVCDTVLLDRVRNATRHRRRVQGNAAPDVVPTGIDPLSLMADAHYRRTRPFGELAANDPDDDTED